MREQGSYRHIMSFKTKKRGMKMTLWFIEKDVNQGGKIGKDEKSEGNF